MDCEGWRAQVADPVCTGDQKVIVVNQVATAKKSPVPMILDGFGNATGPTDHHAFKVRSLMDVARVFLH